MANSWEDVATAASYPWVDSLDVSNIVFGTNDIAYRGQSFNVRLEFFAPFNSAAVGTTWYDTFKVSFSHYCDVDVP